MSDDQSPWRPESTTPPSGGFGPPPQWSPPTTGNPSPPTTGNPSPPTTGNPSPPTTGNPPPPAGFEPPVVGGLAASPPPSPARSSTGKLVGGLIGVVAVVAAGTFAVTQLGDDSSGGGAGSAREVGTDLIAALEQEDVLGVVDLLLPGERETFREPLERLVDNLRRIEVLDDSASLDKIGGVDFEFSDITVEEDPSGDPDITDFVINGTEVTTVNGEEIPLGSLILERVFGGERPPVDEDPQPGEVDDLRLTAVERDGQWYLSVFYTIAEAARRDAGAEVPEQGVSPEGADEPEEAIEHLLQAAIDLDLESIIAGLNPNEAEALQRYAPLFLPDRADLEEALEDVQLSLTDTEYSVKGSGSSRYVSIDGFTFTAKSEGETVTAKLADDCLTVTMPEQEPQEYCTGDDSNGDPFAQLQEFFPPEAVDAIRELQGVLADAFDDHESTGLKVDEVDGRWYFSPIGSSADAFLSVLEALDREEVELLIDAFSDFVTTMEGIEGGARLPDVFDPGVLQGGLGGLSTKIGQRTEDGSTGTRSTLPPSTTAPRAPATTAPRVPSTTAPRSTASDDDVDTEAFAKCYLKGTPAAGMECLRQGVADGDIDPLLVPAPILHPECGVAEVYYSATYVTLGDAEFVAMATNAAPCFRTLVNAGRVQATLVPPELRRPDCLQGKNYFKHPDDAARFFTCALR